MVFAKEGKKRLERCALPFQGSEGTGFGLSARPFGEDPPHPTVQGADCVTAVSVSPRGKEILVDTEHCRDKLLMRQASAIFHLGE